jgi:uncharacterized protein YciI
MMDKDGAQKLRADNREAHLAYLDRHKDHVKAGGPILSEDRKDMIGSLLIVSFETRNEVDAFLKDEPYARAGLFKSVNVYPWRRAIFRE